MKKRILFLSWRDIKHKKAGGAEVFTHETLSRLDKNHYDIIHISPKSTNKSGQVNPKREVIDTVTYLRFGNIFTVILYAIQFYFKHRKKIDFVVDQCNTHRFFTPIWVSRKKRVFFIHQMTKEIWTMNLPKPIGLIGQHLEVFMTWIYRNSYLLLTVSDSTKKDLIACGIKEKKIAILPEGINFKPWEIEEFEEKEKGLFTYVGRYSNYKGINVAVEAFCRVNMKYPYTHLRIIGKKNADYIAEVLEPIRKKYNIDPLVIEYLGFVSEEEKFLQMSRSICLLFPSLREGWGLTVTESAAVGTPSIVYHSPGLIDAVDQGRAGYLSKKNNVFEIQALMEQALTDPNEYEKIRIAAYEFSKNFNWDNTAKVFTQYL